MDSIFKPPENLVLEGNIAENLKKFIQKYELFMEATGYSGKPQEKKKAMFLNLVGDEGLELFNTFTWENNEEKTETSIIKKFETYCSPKKNEIYERFLFNSIVQKEGQPFNSFVTELKKAVRTTGYAEKDDMIRDRIVIGIHGKTTQEKLLRDPELTLEKAINTCRSIEVSKIQSKVLQNEASLNAIQKAGKEKGLCGACGYNHPPRRCPAFRKTCAKCQGRNHFANVCQNNKLNRDTTTESNLKKPPRRKNVYEVKQTSESEQSDGDSEFFISALSVCKNVGTVESDNSWKEAVEINNQKILFKLDTGAEVSVLSEGMLKKLRLLDKLVTTDITLIAYGSNQFRIKPLGQISLMCKVGDKKSEILFIVVKSEGQIPLLGLQACVDLKLIKRLDAIEQKFESLDDITKNYSEVFKGLGKFPNKYHITIKEDACPYIMPIRRVPQSLHEKLKKKLDDLEKLGVIRKVDKPTEWVHPLVIVEKTNKDLRLCLDPKHLNNAIKREHFLIPSVEEICAKLSNQKYFTVLDMKDGYWQVELDNASADLCTFGTPFGRFQFVRMPFGISSAPEVFQKKNFEIFGDLTGVGLYFDDLIVTGSTEAEHDDNLKRVLDRAVKYNIKFNFKKIQFKAHNVKFLGQIFSKNGVESDKSYTKAIIDMPVPQSKPDLLRLLGMVKFVGKFIPSLSKITAPLRNLTRNDVEWKWDQAHTEAVIQIKHLLTTAPVLAFFDPKKPIELETDASKDGLGACLLQSEHPIAFASRSLTQTEQNYAQIEKEALAIVFAIQKFHFLIYGYDVKVNTDHKPLETIFRKNLQSISPRLQRMRMRIINYNLQVSYKPGKFLYISDTLSRASLKETETKTSLDLERAVHANIKLLPISDNRIEQFESETKKDKQLQIVLKFVQQGWPKQKSEIAPVKHYFKIKDELITYNQLLFVGNKLVVPLTMRKEMLKLLHEGHLGIEKTKNRARTLFYWPHLSSDIEAFITACSVCEKFARKNSKETLNLYQKPQRPWERVGADIFSYANKSYLVLFDAYSNWLELVPLNDKSTESVIQQMKKILARFGSPDCLVTDNIPFGSYRFQDFAKEWNFKLVLRSPNYPQSNGLAEKAVSISKNMLKKSLEENKDIESYLLQYRNAPLKHLSYSPSQLLNSRGCKTKLPTPVTLLKPAVCGDVAEKIEFKRNAQIKYYNKQSKDLKPLEPGDNITVYNHPTKTWDQGQIINKHSSPRSYLIRDNCGNTVRRNRIDLKPSSNTYQESNSLDEPEDEPQSVITNKVWEGNNESMTNITTSLSEPSAPIRESIVTTRMGRVVKKPDKLNL